MDRWVYSGIVEYFSTKNYLFIVLPDDLLIILQSEILQIVFTFKVCNFIVDTLYMLRFFFFFFCIFSFYNLKFLVNIYLIKIMRILMRILMRIVLYYHTLYMLRFFFFCFFFSFYNLKFLVNIYLIKIMRIWMRMVLYFWEFFYLLHLFFKWREVT